MLCTGISLDNSSIYLSNCIDICKFLVVEGGADIHECNHDGYSVMHYAAMKGRRELVSWLSEYESLYTNPSSVS